MYEPILSIRAVRAYRRLASDVVNQIFSAGEWFIGIGKQSVGVGKWFIGADNG